MKDWFARLGLSPMAAIRDSHRLGGEWTGVPLHSRFSPWSDAPHLKGRRGSLRDSDVARRFGTRPFTTRWITVSVIVFGQATPVDDQRKLEALKAFGTWWAIVGRKCVRRIGKELWDTGFGTAPSRSAKMRSGARGWWSRLWVARLGRVTLHWRP